MIAANTRASASDSDQSDLVARSGLVLKRLTLCRPAAEYQRVLKPVHAPHTATNTALLADDHQQVCEIRLRRTRRRLCACASAVKVNRVCWRACARSCVCVYVIVNLNDYMRKRVNEVTHPGETST